MNTKIPSNTDLPDRRTTDRYAQLELETETVVIYDREQTHAWIQSDTIFPTETATESDSDDYQERRLAAKHATRPGNGGALDG